MTTRWNNGNLRPIAVFAASKDIAPKSSVLRLFRMPIGCCLAIEVALCCCGTMPLANRWPQSRLTLILLFLVWQSLLMAGPSCQAAGISLWSCGASIHNYSQWSNSTVTKGLYLPVWCRRIGAGCTLAAPTKPSACGIWPLVASWQACSLILMELPALRWAARFWYPAVMIKPWSYGHRLHAASSHSARALWYCPKCGSGSDLLWKPARTIWRWPSFICKRLQCARVGRCFRSSAGSPAGTLLWSSLHHSEIRWLFGSFCQLWWNHLLVGSGVRQSLRQARRT